MGIEEERIELQKQNKEKQNKKRKEWMQDRFRKWSTIILKWFGILFILLAISIFSYSGFSLNIILVWLGMFGNDLLYELGIIKPWDREKLVVEFKEDREHL